MANRSSSDLKHDGCSTSRPKEASSATVLGLLVSCCLVFHQLFFGVIAEAAMDPRESHAFSAEEMSLLAHHFAPVLLFHPSEEHFPCSPLFPLESHANSDERVADRLGTAKERNLRYLQLSLEEKAELATVYYRARRVRQGSELKVIVDYWLYYVWNDYRVRGGLFPIWLDRSHPNDLEHIHLILKYNAATKSDDNIPSVEGRFKLQAVYSSAHEGTMPANRYHPAREDATAGYQFIVELGAHALAPDANKDGLFTPGIDGRSGYKLLWGVRDKGITWSWYRASYTQPRSEGDRILFLPPGDQSGDEFTYQLISADELRSQFREAGLTQNEHEEVFETRVHWLRRFLGKSNGEAHRLVEPPDLESQGDEIGLNGFSSTERGVLVGGTSLADNPGVFVGGRYGFLHGEKLLPDLFFQLDGILTSRGRALLSSQICLAYPISVASKVMAGGGLLTDSISFSNKQWDWLVGFEVRLGHLQISAGVRSTGQVNDEAVDVRLAYFF